MSHMHQMSDKVGDNTKMVETFATMLSARKNCTA